MICNKVIYTFKEVFRMNNFQNIFFKKINAEFMFFMLSFLAIASGKKSSN